MLQRIAAIVFIFICASIGWMILAATLRSRTNSADSGLRGHVVSTWGAPHESSMIFGETIFCLLPIQTVSALSVVGNPSLSSIQVPSFTVLT